MGKRKVDYLTPIQEQIVRYIRQRISETGQAPTLKEIGAAVGRSAGGVHYQLVELEAKYAVVRDPFRPRAIRLT